MSLIGKGLTLVSAVIKGDYASKYADAAAAKNVSYIRVTSLDCFSTFTIYHSKVKLLLICVCVCVFGRGEGVFKLDSFSLENGLVICDVHKCVLKSM